VFGLCHGVIVSSTKALNEGTERLARGKTVTFVKSDTYVVVVVSDKLN
jgi:hypothetical protein